MNVTKLENADSIKYKAGKPTNVELNNEYNYLVAESFTKKLLEQRLISQVEFNKIMAKNREIFSPILAEIMP